MKTKVIVTALAALLALDALAQTKDELKQRVDQLELELQNTKVKLVKAEEELKKCKEAVNTAVPYVKRARELPVNLGRRKALTGSGFVLELQNASTKTLPVKVTLISPTFSKTNTFDLVLDGAKLTGPLKEIGHKEGWPGSPGDLVEIESEGYDPIRKHF